MFTFPKFLDVCFSVEVSLKTQTTETKLANLKGEGKGGWRSAVLCGSGCLVGFLEALLEITPKCQKPRENKNKDCRTQAGRPKQVRVCNLVLFGILVICGVIVFSVVSRNVELWDEIQQNLEKTSKIKKAKRQHDCRPQGG